MAVAVKTSPGARPSSLMGNPALLSLIGLLYLLGCLGIVFKLLPDLWWWAWDGAGFGRAFLGGIALAIVALAVGVGLLALGVRLLGPHPPTGVRSGVFVAFLGLILVLLLARWASLWIEHWAYDSRSFPQTTGVLITAAVAVVLLGVWIRLFTREWMQGYVVRLEQAGWFHAIAYKHNQGQKVRRATIFGILLLVGAGVWTMVSHRTLVRATPDWALSIPFTGKMGIESYGDTEGFIAELPDDQKNQVEVRFAGASSLPLKTRISFDRYQQAVVSVLADEKVRIERLLPKAQQAVDEADEAVQEAAGNKEKEKAAREKLDDARKQVRSAELRLKQVAVAEEAVAAISQEGAVVFLKTLNGRLHDQIVALLRGQVFPQVSDKDKPFREDIVRRLRDVDSGTKINDMTRLINEVNREANNAKRGYALNVEFILPRAVLLVDRYVMRDEVNARTDKNANVFVTAPGESKFEVGQIVAAERFAAEVKRIKEASREPEPPESRELVPAEGPTSFATLTLLPSIQYTVPLLLIAVSMWLAWRLVNMPTFADFLIATEAEMNKVSWTTQKRLIQDTIVVLVTTLLMAIFLFGMDWTWKTVLSWRYIGVLHIPQEKPKGVEKKNW